RIFAAQMKLAPAVCFLTTADAQNTAVHLRGIPVGDLSHLDAFLARFGTALVVGQVEGEKAFGVPPELPAQLLARPGVRHVLIEADGSRMRPIKAPAAHEPVIPPQTTLVVPVMGMDALERPLHEAAHRPELVQEVISEQYSVISGQYSVNGDTVLTPVMAAALLAHPQGGLKGVPGGARVIPAINKVDSPARLAAARQVARHILRLTDGIVPQVVLSAAHRDEPVREVWRREDGGVTAVILAAGQSKRMGRNKLALPWGAGTVLDETVRQMGGTAVPNLLLITGHEAAQAQAVAARHGVPTLHNPHYAAGELITSVQAALRSLPESITAVLVVLGDQPGILPQTIDQLLAAYAQGQGAIIAPTYQGRRGNPVLIDRRFFADLLALPAAAAPRDVLRRYPQAVTLLPVNDPAILQDLDKPEDYERLRP
ncbi:MAG: putative selenium-dependent hydroxylase accessory protein YqeC, partial [Anaerolineales bacterium]|nr:putative selenium-dependent hydroxylase accessory protein YqeC [Anaerolineales bacterium]